MRKQTKLVAVLSTAALLAIGASMTSFAATGWAEEDGTWVYYDKSGNRVTEQWKKSGNNWYYLDSDGEMAVDQLIEDGDNYYYVDVNGVMASNQWVAIENEDAGEEDEPDQHWYYFQANGKALKNTTDKTALKTVNGKKYTFDDEGKMLYGWVDANGEHIDDTDGDAFKEGIYYFGDENDGAMTVGWLLMDITYDGAEGDNYTAPAFNDDEDQSRWFYFKSNGKKIYNEKADENFKEKTINGKKYAFDDYGTMIAEWSIDAKEANAVIAEATASTAVDSKGKTIADRATQSDLGAGSYAKLSRTWRYFNSVEDGSRISKGWFKVVPAEMLNAEKNNDDEASWYYADGKGDVYAGETRTIKGKKYMFRNDGRMLTGLKFVLDGDKDYQGYDDIKADDDSSYPFDTEDDFVDNATSYYLPNGYKCYYFGGGDDGSMKTGKVSISIDGDNYSFEFSKSGSNKGVGITGEKDDKYYLAGMLLKAGRDEKYQVIKDTKNVAADGNIIWDKLDDAPEFLTNVDAVVKYDSVTAESVAAAKKASSSFNKKADDLKELYVIDYSMDDTATDKGIKAGDYRLINTSGKAFDKKSKNKDGDDYVFVTNAAGDIVVVYVED